jgi:hypothetical protein
MTHPAFVQDSCLVGFSRAEVVGFCVATKFSQDDLKERERWGAYRKAYEALLGATSTKDAPWYIVPADSKKNARLIVSQIILDRLDQLKLAYPVSTEARQEELAAIGKEL